MARLKQRTPEAVDAFNEQFGTPDEQGNYSRVVPVTDPTQAYKDILSKGDTSSGSFLHAATKLHETGQLGQTPKGLEVKDGKIQRDRPMIDPALLAMMIVGGGAFAAPALAGALGGGAGAAPGLSSLPVSAGATVPTVGGVSSLSAPVLAGAGSTALTGGGSVMNGITMGGQAGTGAGTGAASTAASGAAKGMNALPWIKTGLDFFGGLLGGDDENEQPTKPYFEGTGPTDPRNMLFNVLQQLYPLAAAQQDQLKQGVNLRSSYVPEGPKPISIPGLPFQIGGGLGMDPAVRASGLLSLPGLNFPDPSTLFGPSQTHPQLGGSQPSGGSGGSGSSGDSASKRFRLRRRNQ